jgi:hypothetical protein
VATKRGLGSTPALTPVLHPAPHTAAPPPCASLFDSHPRGLTHTHKQVKLNTDESPGVVDEYDVSVLPTVMLFIDGKKIDSVIGYPSGLSRYTSTLGAWLASWEGTGERANCGVCNPPQQCTPSLRHPRWLRHNNNNDNVLSMCSQTTCARRPAELAQPEREYALRPTVPPPSPTGRSEY